MSMNVTVGLISVGNQFEAALQLRFDVSLASDLGEARFRTCTHARPRISLRVLKLGHRRIELTRIEEDVTERKRGITCVDRPRELGEEPLERHARELGASRPRKCDGTPIRGVVGEPAFRVERDRAFERGCRRARIARAKRIPAGAKRTLCFASWIGALDDWRRQYGGSNRHAMWRLAPGLRLRHRDRRRHYDLARPLPALSILEDADYAMRPNLDTAVLDRDAYELVAVNLDLERGATDFDFAIAGDDAEALAGAKWRDVEVQCSLCEAHDLV
jgi:hypothetical protein